MSDLVTTLAHATVQLAFDLNLEVEKTYGTEE
jgi:hypothetical protein